MSAAHRRRGQTRLTLTITVLVAVAVAGTLAAVLATAGGHHAHSAAGAAQKKTTTTTLTPSSTSAAPAGSGAVSTAVENARVGTSDWTLDGAGTHPAAHDEIAGYFGAVSVDTGGAVQLYVSTTDASWRAVAYRMGWYGGKLAREVWSSPSTAGVAQPPPTRVPGVNMVDTGWKPSLTIAVGSQWPPGDYLFKLISSSGAASYVPLTVRDDSSRAPILIVNAVTTWEAYNLWGGADLYSGTGGRSDEVTFDRPYELGNGSGDFLGNEEKLVKLVEKEGLDVTYTTDVDLQERPALIQQHRVLVSLGHDEYWSTGMRAAVEAARDAGVNLLFLGANAVYRHIRFDASPLGPDRREINYRIARNDPLDGVDNAEVTVQWRDPPVSKPENTLLGEMYECNPVKADMVVGDPSVWVFAGAGLTAGQHLPGLVGSEYDHWTPGLGPAVQDVARSPVTCRGRASTSDFTYYNAPSGAGVIDTGTNLWVPSILDDPRIGATVAQVTLTMLRAAAAGPLGRTHPAVPTPASGSSKVTIAPPQE